MYLEYRQSVAPVNLGSRWMPPLTFVHMPIQHGSTFRIFKTEFAKE